MTKETTFRKALIHQLVELVNSRELDGQFVQMQYVEEQQDVLGEFHDYYTDELLGYEPFAKEFSECEIGGLRAFIEFLRTTDKGGCKWSEVRAQATALLALLRDNAQKDQWIRCAVADLLRKAGAKE